ncbi:MAG: hypothetical protein NTX71_08610 [Candidatus Aureabacteria bacterium]|nr:hypothetical protein [Candidatus Auribacterota bacterium]
MKKHTMSNGEKQEVDDSAHHRRVSRRRIIFFSFLLCCGAFAIRWAILSGLHGVVGPDSHSYMKACRYGVLRHLFYMVRPRGYPLLISAFGCNTTLIVLFQRALSGITWLCVSVAFARRLHRPLFRWLAPVSLFALGCTFCVIFWDINVMTESVSLSTLLILITILLCRDGTRRNLCGVRALALISFYFSMLRVTNICFLPALALYLFALELRPPRGRQENLKRRAMRIFLICLVPASFLFFLYETKQSHRGEDNLINALNMRVFLREDEAGKQVFDEENFNYFVEHYAMPDAEVKKYVDHAAWQHTARHTPRYDAWVAERGYAAYLAFLRTHPGWVLRQFRHIGRYYAMNYEWLPRDYHFGVNGAEGTGLTMSRRLQSLFFNTLGMLVYPDYAFLILPLILIALVIWWLHLQRRGVTPPPSTEAVATLCILFYLAAVITPLAWFGDADNPRRHMVTGIVSYYLGAVMLLWLLVDLLVERRSRRPSPLLPQG